MNRSFCDECKQISVFDLTTKIYIRSTLYILCLRLKSKDIFSFGPLSTRSSIYEAEKTKASSNKGNRCQFSFETLKIGNFLSFPLKARTWVQIIGKVVSLHQIVKLMSSELRAINIDWLFKLRHLHSSDPSFK